MESNGLPRGIPRNISFTHQRSKSSPHTLHDRDFEAAAAYAALQQQQRPPPTNDEAILRAILHQSVDPSAALAYQDLLSRAALIGQLSGNLSPDPLMYSNDRQNLAYPGFMNYDAPQLSLGGRSYMQNPNADFINYREPNRPTHDRKRTQSSDAAIASMGPLNTRHMNDEMSGGSEALSPDDDNLNGRTDRETKKVNLYKTELCRSWEETGYCRYGAKCQFAHSETELRHVDRHPKYKTEMCKTFWEKGTCPYGKRCCFIHTDRDMKGLTRSESLPARPTHHGRSRSVGAILRPLVEEEESMSAYNASRGLSSSFGFENGYSDQDFHNQMAMANSEYRIDEDINELNELDQMFQASSISANGVATPVLPTSPGQSRFPQYSDQSMINAQERINSMNAARSFQEGYNFGHQRHRSINHPISSRMISSPPRQSHMSHASESYITNPYGRQMMLNQMESGYDQQTLSQHMFGSSVPNVSLPMTVTSPVLTPAVTDSGIPINGRPNKEELSRSLF